MSALLDGYNYDIFISYRQKDNKYDGWVTEFVENLKRELEATFKEEVSVYFDINPHDGLLETHDVDASLKEKLKCLVFIPVISRTYCDPKSFAWEHEFKAFVEQALHDHPGLKVNLPDGNVSLRVLPVRIHDLDIADVKLCESILGTVLRGVEFIYKSPGVNRPLRSTEDNPHANLNKTIYRDQINKVALAVKVIIEGMLSAGRTDDQIKAGREEKEAPAFTNKPVRSPAHAWSKTLFIIIPLLLLFAGFIFLFSGATSIDFNKRDWVVISDFENTTGDAVFDKSLYTAFSLTANQSRYINVLPRQRMLETLSLMKKSPEMFIDDMTGREIAERQNIDICIVPGISQVGDRYVISAKIVDAGTGNILISEVLYASGRDDILTAIDKLSRKVRRDLGESRYSISTQDKPLSRVTTSSLEALKLYSQGIDHHYKLDFSGARDYYERALLIDTGFTSAKASLGNILVEKFDQEKGKELIRQAVRSVDNLTDKEKYGILGFYAVSVENDLAKGIEYTRRLTDLYPDDPAYRNNLGWYYQLAGSYGEAVKEYKAAVKLNPRQALSYGGILWIYLEKLGHPDSAYAWARKMISDNPQNAWSYTYLGSALICYDSLPEAEAAFRKSREINPSVSFNLFRLAHTCSMRGGYDDAIHFLREIQEISPGESYSVWYDMGAYYQMQDNVAEAKKYLNDFLKYATDVWEKKSPDDANTYISVSAVAARLGDMNMSRRMLEKAVSLDSTLHPRYAGLLCLQGKTSEALDEIHKALAGGYRDLAWLKMDPDLRALQYDIRFINMLEQYFFKSLH